MQAEEDEEIMLDAAVHESLQTSWPEPTGGASSSSRANAQSKVPSAAMHAAAAAERRLAKTRLSHTVYDDSTFDLSQDGDVLDFQVRESSLSAISSSSEDEALSSAKAKKGKGKQVKGKGKQGKGKGKQPADTATPKFMSVSEMRKKKREAREQAKEAKRENKKEEDVLSKQLGRKLTAVRHSVIIAVDVLSNSCRVRKAPSRCKSITQNSRTSGAILKTLLLSSCPRSHLSQLI